MSDVSNYHELPLPDTTARGANHNDRGIRNPHAVARKWRPRGAPQEPPVSTIARFAGRLIDRLTGKAYSADELIAEILAHSSNRSPGTPVYAVTASLPTLTMTDQPLDGDQFIVSGGGVTDIYTFRDIPLGPKDIEIGVDIATSMGNFIGTSMGALVLSGTLETDEVDIAASTAGVSGNLVHVFCSNDNIFGAVDENLTGGIDATLAAQGDQLFDEDFIYTALVDIISLEADTGWGKSVIDPL